MLFELSEEELDDDELEDDVDRESDDSEPLLLEPLSLLPLDPEDDDEEEEDDEDELLEDGDLRRFFFFDLVFPAAAAADRASLGATGGKSSHQGRISFGFFNCGQRTEVSKTIQMNSGPHQPLCCLRTWADFDVRAIYTREFLHSYVQWPV